METINYIKISTAGNPTILVENPIPRNNQPQIAYKLLNSPLGGEQVGFIEPPISKKAVVRLQMMGGEFCANALRAAIGWLAINSPQPKIRFKIETSGSGEVINGRIKYNRNKKIQWVETRVPLPKQIQPTEIFGQKISKVPLDGITIFLLKKREIEITGGIENQFKNLCKKSKSLATGLISYRKLSQKVYEIKPLIYVRATKTIIEETACGSATLALGFLLTSREKRTSEFKVVQPSKLPIYVRICWQKNRPYRAFLKSQVKIEQKGKISL